MPVPIFGSLGSIVEGEGQLAPTPISSEEDGILSVGIHRHSLGSGLGPPSIRGKGDFHGFSRFGVSISTSIIPDENR